MSINVKEAIVKAKAYAEDLFDVGTSGRVTLEEVWFDDSSNEWSVTVGIRHRKAERLLNPLVSLSSLERLLRSGVQDRSVDAGYRRFHRYP